MAQSFPFPPSITVGIILRTLLHTFLGATGNNDKLAGALCGVWDGVLAYTAYRTDRLLEPLVLLEVVGGVCFDALYTGDSGEWYGIGGGVRVETTTMRIVSLALGCVLGVLISDAMRLADVWEDIGEEVQKNLNVAVLEVEADSDLDLDASSELDFDLDLDEGSFSEDVFETVVYGEPRRRQRQSRNLSLTLPSILKSPTQTYPTHLTQMSPRTRTRKVTTAEWILAQRQAGRSSKSTSRRASHNVSTADADMDGVDLGGGVDTENTLSLSLLDLDFHSQTETETEKDGGTSSSRTRTLTRSKTRTSHTRTQTESSRGRRDREALASMTPIPGGTSAPSIPSIPSIPSTASRSGSGRDRRREGSRTNTKTNLEINIAVLPPSVSTRRSSPTIRTMDIDLIHGDRTGTSRDGVVIDVPKPSSPPKSDGTAKREARKDQAESASASMNGATRSAPVVGQNHSLSTEYTNININGIHRTSSHRSTHTGDHKPQAQSPRSTRRTGTHAHTTTDPGPSRRSSFQPFIPPRPSPSLTRTPTVISVVEGRSAASPQFVHPIGPYAYYARPQVDVPSFRPASTDASLSEKRARSRASTERSRSSAHRAKHQAGDMAHIEEVGSQYEAYAHAHSPALDVVIDYVPPPAETGINVRVVPREEEEDRILNSGGRGRCSVVELGHRGEDLHSHDHDILFPAHSIGSGSFPFPDLDSVPPPGPGHTIRPGQDDDEVEVEARSHAEDLTSSSSTSNSHWQPPSTFDFKTAWRNSGSAPPPSPPLTDYAAAAAAAGDILDDQDPLPVSISESLPIDSSRDSGNFTSPEPNLNFNDPGTSPSPSSSARQRQTRSQRSRPRPRSATVASRSDENTKANTLELDLDVRASAEGFTLPVQTLSVEWFRVGPAQWRDRTSSSSRRHDHSHSHTRSHSRGRSRSSGRSSGQSGGREIIPTYDVHPTDEINPLERASKAISIVSPRATTGLGQVEEKKGSDVAHRYQPKHLRQWDHSQH